MVGRPPRPLTERFWQMVEKTDSCWLWKGYRSHNGRGYGRIVRQVGQAPYPVHRLSWEWTHGPIPDGLLVLHDCPGGDNPGCVNPDHLRLGTEADNSRDRILKGQAARGDKNGSRLYPERLWRGEKNVNAKLTAEKIREIRQKCSQGRTQRSIAAEYDISPVLVGLIARRKAWAHVE